MVKVAFSKSCSCEGGATAVGVLTSHLPCLYRTTGVPSSSHGLGNVLSPRTTQRTIPGEEGEEDRERKIGRGREGEEEKQIRM